MSKNDINEGIELITAYIQTNFQDECAEWNDILDKLNTIGRYNNNIILNYTENLELIIKKISFKNECLDNIDKYIIEAKKIDKEINEISLKMSEKIVSKINENTKIIKDSLNFKF